MYSKSLSKMANKLNKACRELPGSIADAWRGVATEMETRSDIHRQLSASLADEVVKPLKSIVEGHHKTRKSVRYFLNKSIYSRFDSKILRLRFTPCDLCALLQFLKSRAILRADH